MANSPPNEISPRERHPFLSSSSSIVTVSDIVDRIDKERSFFNGESLSLGYERVYGNHWNAIPVTVFEQQIFDKHGPTLDLIEAQRVYHFNGLLKQFEHIVSRRNIERVQPILIKRGLLFPLTITGKAKSSFGMVLLCTKNATIDDITAYLREYEAYDDLRYRKQLQREDKKSPEDVVKHNQAVKEKWAASQREMKEKLEKVVCKHGNQISECEDCSREYHAKRK